MTEEVTLEQIEQLFEKIFDEKFGPTSEIATSVRELLTFAGDPRTILGESSTSAGRLITDVSSLSCRMERLTEDLKRIKPGSVQLVPYGPLTGNRHTGAFLHPYPVPEPVKRRRRNLG